MHWLLRSHRPFGTFATALLLLLVATDPALAQGPGGMPSLPPGPASISGQVQGPDGPAADVDVALYALTAQGHPGIGGTKTDANGNFRFPDIANDPGIAYLVGARFGGIPFSERLAFQPGQTSLDVTIEVTAPIADTSGIEIASTRIRFDWAGSQLAVRETHVLRNPGESVVYVDPEQRRDATRPLAVSTLPEQASEFTRLPVGGDSDLVLSGRDVAFWGPFFPGEQELDFQYLLPADAGEQAVLSRFPSGTASIAVAYPETGPQVEASELHGSGLVELDGVEYRSLEGGALAPGASLALRVTLPSMRLESDALALTRTDLFLELDDASLIVNQDVVLEVTPGAPLVAPAGEALLRLELPKGAQLIGMSREAAAIGAGGNGEVVGIAGPLPAGTTRFGFRYALAVDGEAVNLDLQFPLLVDTLRINIADTGDLIVSSNRLHRLRPARSGTRTYLQREAFHVEPGEVVKLSLARPLDTPLPRNAALGVLLALGALACWFLVRPLQTAGGSAPDAPEHERISRERALVYATIHDLEHDFETGKIAEDDYRSMRAELRANAVDLLRRERMPQPAAPRVAALPRAAEEPPRGDAPPAVVPTSRFCPSCGGRVDPAWRFCSHCGGGLSPSAGDEAMGVARDDAADDAAAK